MEVIMKIGFKTKSYSSIVYFDLDEVSDEKTFIDNLINSARTGGDEEVDLIIQPNRKEIKEQTKTTEEE
jgi:hypothetical protein